MAAACFGGSLPSAVARSRCSTTSWGSGARPAQAADHLTDLTQPHLALVRDRSVDRDPVHPRLGGCDRLPGCPLFVSAFERILRAILGGGPIAEHRRQSAENFSVRGLIK